MNALPHDPLNDEPPVEGSGPAPSPDGPGSWVSWSPTLAELAAVVPSLISGVSPLRQTIITDQVRAALESDRADELACWVVGRASDRTPVAAILCAQPLTGDTLNILHASFLGPSPSPADVIRPLRQRLAAHCRDRSVGYVQWAMDPDDDATGCPTQAAARWPMSLGLSWMGTLDYLAIQWPGDGDRDESGDEDVDGDSEIVPHQTGESRGQFHTLDPDDPAAAAAFDAVVSQTYVDSLDCPELESHRTPTAILDGYRRASTYSPDLWFTVTDRLAADAVVGCVILARHRSPDPATGVIVELVYMGVVPRQRGLSWGDVIMRQVLRRCRDMRASRLILAVDRRNHPAMRLYRRLGLRRLFSESVWVNSDPSSA